MNPNFLRHALSTFVLVLAVVACVLPGQAPRSVPTPNSINIETAVAGTARAAELQTQQASPATATAITIPTDTPMSPEVISSFGTSLVKLADGSTQFKDYRAGVQIVFPPLWLVFRVGELEYYEVWKKEETRNPDLLHVFTAVQDQDPNTTRVNAIDIRPGHTPNGIATTINIMFWAGDVQSLKQIEQTARAHHPPCADFKFISSSYSQANNGTQVLVFDASCLASGDVGTVYYRHVVFDLPAGKVNFGLETNFDYKDDRIAEFDQVINSLTLFNP